MIFNKIHIRIGNMRVDFCGLTRAMHLYVS